MWEVVIDTNVLVAALRSREGASNRLIRRIGLDSRWRINFSTALLMEYHALMLRPGIVPIHSPADIDAILDYLCQVGVERTPAFSWRPYLCDEADDFILDLAAAARADFLVTFNRRDFLGVEAFGIEVVTPGEFLRRLGEE